MNKDRKKRIEALLKKVEELHDDLSSVIGEEQDAVERTPEALRGNREEKLEELEQGLCSLTDGIDEIRNVLK